MLLGRIPVEYEPYHFREDAEGLYAARRVHTRSTPFYWNPDFFHRQWFIDAFTVDPADIVADRTGISIKGEPQPIMESEIAHMTVGRLPKVMVYIAIHEKRGVHAFFAYHGAKHGGKADKKADAKMYEGFDFWYQTLSDEHKAFIKERNYYNCEESVEKFRKRVSAQAFKAFQEGPFHPKYFMVRRPSCAQAHPARAPTARSPCTRLACAAARLSA